MSHLFESVEDAELELLSISEQVDAWEAAKAVLDADRKAATRRR